MNPKLEKILKMAVETLGDDDKKVIKSLKMKEEWIRMHDELEALTDDLSALVSKADTKRKLMWATIEEDLGIYDKQLRIDPDKNILEVLDKE